MLTRDPDGLFHPASESEIIELVLAARAAKQQLRVHGARHSEPMVVGTEAFQAGRHFSAFDLRLDKLSAISIDHAAKQVTVQAGCRFGADPREANVNATVERSLNAALDAAGLALPNLGGVSHQSIGGFLMTGSAGGSVLHSLGDAVLSLRLIDGHGVVHDLDRSHPRFPAALVSLGVLGIITSVRFACVDRYDVVGEEQVLAGDRLPFDRHADGALGLEGFLREREYARVLWWPQAGVDKWVLWSGRRVPVEASARVPYEAFPPVLGSRVIPQAAAGWALGAIGRRSWFTAGETRKRLFNLFVPTDAAPRHFRDQWWRALPMDDQIEETLLPTRFTEIWLPLEKAGEVLRRLHRAYRKPGAEGSFALEIYAAGKSHAWLSPGYGRDSLRLNFFWFDKNPENPARAYFPQFWDLFADLEPRFHWGKLVPDPSDPAACAMRASYAQWSVFCRERDLLDPEQVFLTGPWRARLGMEDTAGPRVLPRFVAERRRPLWFPMQDAGLSIADDPKARRLVAETEIERSAEDLYSIIERLTDNTKFVPGFQRIEIIDPLVHGEGQRLREHFSFMTLDLKIIAAEPGRRWAATVQAASLPLATQMVEVIDFAALGEARTKVTWAIHFTSHPDVAWGEPAVLPVFDAWLRRMVHNLKRFAEAQARSSADS